LREEYIKDCELVLKRWNRALAKEGSDFEVSLPHRRFFRRQGLYASTHYDPQGNPISAEEFERRRSEWLPSDAEREYVHSLMKPVYEPGKMANWIAAPKRGINRLEPEYEYVRLA